MLDYLVPSVCLQYAAFRRFSAAVTSQSKGLGYCEIADALTTARRRAVGAWNCKRQTIHCLPHSCEVVKPFPAIFWSSGALKMFLPRAQKQAARVTLHTIKV